MIWAVFAACLFVPMVLQWMVLRLTRRGFRILRLSLLTLPALLARQGHWYLTAPFEEYPHHEGVVGTLFWIFAALSLLGWALGWVIYKRGEKEE